MSKSDLEQATRVNALNLLLLNRSGRKIILQMNKQKLPILPRKRVGAQAKEFAGQPSVLILTLNGLSEVRPAELPKGYGLIVLVP